MEWGFLSALRQAKQMYAEFIRAVETSGASAYFGLMRQICLIASFMVASASEIAGTRRPIAILIDRASG
jgi:hypothetical protein